MADMVFAPTFADLDTEREVVLEEIAMYEDTPQELVHDLFSEAVFGGHPLGRPVIGTRGRDLVRLARARSRATTARCTSAGEHRPRRRRQPRARPRARPARAGERAARRSRGARRPRAAAARQDAAAGPALPAQGHRAVPRLRRRARHRRAPTDGASPPRCSTRSSAARPRRACSRRSARSAGWRTPSTASPPSTPTPA